MLLGRVTHALPARRVELVPPRTRQRRIWPRLRQVPEAHRAQLGWSGVLPAGLRWVSLLMLIATLWRSGLHLIPAVLRCRETHTLLLARVLAHEQKIVVTYFSQSKKTNRTCGSMDSSATADFIVSVDPHRNSRETLGKPRETRDLIFPLGGNGGPATDRGR